jgi:glucuronate isomerase
MTPTTLLEKSFLTEDFLLTNEFAKRLYHGYAAKAPIIDYHCHLSPQEIASDKQFGNLTQIWLYGDHYKWRAMRTLGIDESFITGKASDKEKFEKWAYTVPYTMRNPLYHWSHLELSRYFGIDVLLKPESGDYVFEEATALLQTPEYSTRNLMRKMRVETVCTTDDPADTLEHHKAIRQSGFEIKVLPTFRPDKAYAVGNPTAYKKYLEALGQAADMEITTFDQLLAALRKRIAYFHDLGCRLSDHGLEQLYFPEPGTMRNPSVLFDRLMAGNALSQAEAHFYTYSVLIELGRLYHAHEWTQQYHLGAIRNNNIRQLTTLGPDTGYDSIGDYPQAVALSKFLNELDSTNQLAKTILYNLNPADNEVMATMIGNFNDGTVKGKIQFGSAWWFLDQKDGMEKQINALSNLGLLSCFVGMLTDSRSFLSYPRHEYFRRILCNLIGKDVEAGELPADEKWLGKLVSDICHGNARQYFGF